MALGSSAQQEYSIMHLGEEAVGGESDASQERMLRWDKVKMKMNS